MRVSTTIYSLLLMGWMTHVNPWFWGFKPSVLKLLLAVNNTFSATEELMSSCTV